MGTLTPPSTGSYVFSLDGAGSAKLVIDGKTIAELQKVNFKSTAFGMAQFTAGGPVKIVVEHSNDYAVLGSALHLGWYPPHPDEMAAVMQAAKSADLAIVFAGEQLGEGMDKTSPGLPGNQDELIELVPLKTRIPLWCSTSLRPWRCRGWRRWTQSWKPGIPGRKVATGSPRCSSATRNQVNACQ
jgi:hypothetical protein